MMDDLFKLPSGVMISAYSTNILSIRSACGALSKACQSNIDYQIYRHLLPLQQPC